MRIRTYFLFLAAFVLLLNVAPIVAFSQEEHPYKSGDERQGITPDSQESTQAQGSFKEPIRGLKMEGRLKAVDTGKKIFLIQPARSYQNEQAQTDIHENEGMDRNSSEGGAWKELLFHYTDETEVVGSDNSVQGLAGDTGTRVRIEYRAEGNKAIAEKIELLGKSEPGDKSHEKSDADEPSGGESEGGNPIGGR